MKTLKVQVNRKALNKLIYMASKEDTEVFAIGVAKDVNHPLDIEDIVLMPQEVTGASVDVDENGLAKVVDELSQSGVEPAQLRVWLHTHPGKGVPSPSSVDWETLEKYHAMSRWTVMVIFDSEGTNSCGYMMHRDFPDHVVKVDVSTVTFISQEDIDKWDEEYKNNVTKKTYGYTGGYTGWTPEQQYYDHDSRGSSLCHSCDSRVGWLECEVCKKNFCVDCGVALTEMCPNCLKRICLECLEENSPNNIGYGYICPVCKKEFYPATLE